MRPDWKALGGGYATVGLELALSILLGLFGGKWLDGKLGTAPWLMLFGLGCGCAAGFRAVWRAAVRLRRETERDGFRASSADRTARYALERDREKRGD